MGKADCRVGIVGMEQTHPDVSDLDPPASRLHLSHAFSDTNCHTSILMVGPCCGIFLFTCLDQGLSSAFSRRAGDCLGMPGRFQEQKRHRHIPFLCHSLDLDFWKEMPGGQRLEKLQRLMMVNAAQRTPHSFAQD